MENEILKGLAMLADILYDLQDNKNIETETKEKMLEFWRQYDQYKDVK